MTHNNHYEGDVFLEGWVAERGFSNVTPGITSGEIDEETVRAVASDYSLSGSLGGKRSISVLVRFPLTVVDRIVRLQQGYYRG